MKIFIRKIGIVVGRMGAEERGEQRSCINAVKIIGFAHR